MIVVADATPLRYLVLLGYVDVLPALYAKVSVPQAVVRELNHNSAPALVRTWIADCPHWLDVYSDPPSDPALSLLDPGERAALALAETLHADDILIDDWAGRTEAQNRGLHVTGTVGVLAEAHRRGLLDFDAALTKLRATNFRLSADVERSIRQRLFGSRAQP